MKVYERYREYDICRQYVKNQVPFLIPALQRCAFSLRDAKKTIDDVIRITEMAERINLEKALRG